MWQTAKYTCKTWSELSDFLQLHMNLTQLNENLTLVVCINDTVSKTHPVSCTFYLKKNKNMNNH